MHHVKDLSSESPVQAPQCIAVFNPKSSVIKSIIVHMEVKPHQCSECIANCIQVSCDINPLGIHVENNPSESHQCLLFSKQFSQETHLQKQRENHRERKPCTCSKCQKNFF